MPVEGRKPIFLKGLTHSKRGLWGSSGAPSAPSWDDPFDHHFGQAQRDEFHLFRTVKHSVRIHALHQNADSTERDAGNDRKPAENRAQNHDIQNQHVQIANLCLSLGVFQVTLAS